MVDTRGIGGTQARSVRGTTVVPLIQWLVLVAATNHPQQRCLAQKSPEPEHPNAHSLDPNSTPHSKPLPVDLFPFKTTPQSSTPSGGCFARHHQLQELPHRPVEWSASSVGVPSTSISRPLTPPSGPRSITQSPQRITHTNPRPLICSPIQDGQ